MKFISLRQPWASLIIAGHKPIENRDWAYLPKYRGPVAIHASKKRAVLYPEEIKDIERKIKQPLSELPHIDVVGCVIGVAYLDDAWWIHQIPAAIKRKHRFWCQGSGCLYFQRPEVIDIPVPMTGQPGNLFDLPKWVTLSESLLK